MKSRIPKGHTLDVAVECMKAARPAHDPLLIEAMEKIAQEYKGRDKTFDAHADRKRIAAQRAIFASLPEFGPSGIAVDALKTAIIDRAWRLLDRGDCDACDALLEFVPEDDATKMLDEYFKEET